MAGKEGAPLSLAKQFLEQDLPLKAFLEGNPSAESGLDLLSYLDGISAEEAENQSKK